MSQYTKTGTINKSENRSSSEIIAKIAREELDSLSKPDATICWYNLEGETASEKLIKLSDLSVELQQAILEGLDLCERGSLVTLDEYKNRTKKRQP